VGNIPGVKGSLPSTIIAPAGGLVRTHGGAEEVDEAAELLVGGVEGLVVIDVDDEVEELGAAEEVLVVEVVDD
jgi:hypothetical protein